jgi:type II secretion system protein H
MQRTPRSIRENLFRAGRGRAGFSLLEMMMVVLLIGLVAGIAAPPMINYLRSSQLQTQTDQLAADLQLARSLSIANGTVMQFSSTQQGYQLIDTNDGSVVKDCDFDGGLELDQDRDVFFFPWGMADQHSFSLSAGVMERTVNVLPTGMVEVCSNEDD